MPKVQQWAQDDTDAKGGIRPRASAATQVRKLGEAAINPMCRKLCGVAAIRQKSGPFSMKHKPTFIPDSQPCDLGVTSVFETTFAGLCACVYLRRFYLVFVFDRLLDWLTPFSKASCYVALWARAIDRCRSSFEALCSILQQ